nr:hypothetical protein [uncultured Methanospirillum sp.]
MSGVNPEIIFRIIIDPALSSSVMTYLKHPLTDGASRKTGCTGGIQ